MLCAGEEAGAAQLPAAKHLGYIVLLDSRTFTVFGSYEKLLDVPQPSPSEHSCPFPGFPRAASPSQQDTPCPTNKAENIPKCPQFPGLSVPSLCSGQGGTARPQSLHTEAPMEDTLRNQQLHLVLNVP